MSRLAARVLAGSTLALVAGGLLLLERAAPDGLVAWACATALALLTSWELAHMGAFRARGLGPPLYAATLGVSAATWFGYGGFGVLGSNAGSWFLASFLVQYPITLLLALALSNLRTHSGTVEIVAPFPPHSWRESVAMTPVVLAIWSVPPLFGLVPIARDSGTFGLVALLVLSKIGDSAGYFVGRKIGKRHPFPSISPGKTVAGCVASLVAGVVAGAVLVPLAWNEVGIRSLAFGILIGAAVNVAAQAGDLAKSWVKRRAGVKDSSRLLGPSGGVLDVVDSLLFTAPLAVLLWPRIFPSVAPVPFIF